MAGDSPISVRSLERQVNREGARWGLVADVDLDEERVGVAEVIYTAETKFGVGEIKKNGTWRLCTVDDEHPFSAVLGNRIRNGETDIAAPYKRRRALEKEAHARLVAEQNARARAMWRARNSIIATVAGILPAGLRERARAISLLGRK